MFGFFVANKKVLYKKQNKTKHVSTTGLFFSSLLLSFAHYTGQGVSPVCFLILNSVGPACADVNIGW